MYVQYLHFTFHEDNIRRVCEHPRQAEAMRRIVRQFQGQTSVAHRKLKTLRKIRRQFHHLLSTKRLNVSLTGPTVLLVQLLTPSSKQLITVAILK